MKRCRSREFRLVPNPHKDHSGRPLEIAEVQWFDSEGVEHTGTLDLDGILASLGMVVRPGDVLTITVEVNKE